MSHISDQHYIAGLKAGDMSVMKAFIDRYQHMVYTLALRVMHNQEDAEEVAQDTFIKACQSIKSFKGDAKLSTWLYKITYHKSLDYLKKKQRRPQTQLLENYHHGNLGGAEASWDSLESRERRETINRALEQLPAEDGVILSLFYFETLSLKEISGILNLSLNTVKVRLHRSRKRLAVVLEKMLDKETISTYANR